MFYLTLAPLAHTYQKKLPSVAWKKLPSNSGIILCSVLEKKVLSDLGKNLPSKLQKKVLDFYSRSPRR